MTVEEGGGRGGAAVKDVVGFLAASDRPGDARSDRALHMN
jgi:hypothetical protein